MRDSISKYKVGNTCRHWCSVVLGNLGQADVEHTGQSAAWGPHTDNPSAQEAEAGACGKAHRGSASPLALWGFPPGCGHVCNKEVTDYPGAKPK